MLEDESDADSHNAERNRQTGYRTDWPVLLDTQWKVELVRR